MPNIPTIPLERIEGTAPRPTPYDTRRQDPDAFGAGLGEGLVRLAGAVERVTLEADKSAAQAAEATYAQEILGQVHGPQGFRSLQGHNAIQASTEVTEALQKRREELARGLKNERQRALFLERSHPEFLGAVRAVELHTGEQLEGVSRQSFKARMAAAGGAALAVYTDPVERERQLRTAAETVEQEAERLGLDEAGGRAMLETWQRALVKDVLDRLLADTGRAADARAFFKAHEQDLGPLAADYVGKVEQVTKSDAARREEARIWVESRGDPGAALAAVRGIEDTAVADEAGKRLAQRFREDDAARKASDSQPESRLEIALYQGQGLDRRSRDYQILSEEGKARIEQKAHAAARSGRTDQNREDDLLLWEFRALPLAGVQGHDQISLNVDQADLFAQGSPRLRARVKAEQGRIRRLYEANAGADEREFNRRLDALATSLGYRGSRRAQFLATVRGDRVTWLLDNPDAKTMPAEEMNRILSEAVTYGEIPGLLNDQEMMAWQARNKAKADRFRVPPDADQPGLAALERIATERAPAAQPRPLPSGAPGRPAQGPNPPPQPGARPAPAGAAPRGSPVRVQTIEEARALPPGTRFIDPNGVERVR